jgi:hypothetical protein
MSIKDFYLNAYPTDELGEELNDVTFNGLFNEILEGNDIYDYIGVVDSLVRERLFEELASQINETYDAVYDMWLN